MIASSNAEEHEHDLLALLDYLHSVGHKASFFKKKAKINQSSVQYLGQLVLQAQKSILPDCCATVCAILLLDTLAQLQSFLGLCNYRQP